MLGKVWFTLLVFLLLAAACAPLGPAVETPPSDPTPEDPLWTPPPTPAITQPPPNPYAPGKGDESMVRGEVYIDSQEILNLEGSPPQFQLRVAGSLPTPCHELRVVLGEPDEQNQIDVLIWSLVDPNVICAQVLEPFKASIPLGSYPSGSYTVLVNGERVGEFTG